MALRWKKNPRLTGLARVCAGPQWSTLRIDGAVRVATTRCISGPRPTKWYWVAGWELPSIPYKNTHAEPVSTEEEAKAAAMAYVRQFL